MQDLGRITVAALEKPELSGNTYSVASTERLNGTQLAAAFSTGLGRIITFEELPTKEFGEILNSAWGPGAGDAIAKDGEGKNKPDTGFARSLTNMNCHNRSHQHSYPKGVWLMIVLCVWKYHGWVEKRSAMGNVPCW